MQSRQCVCSVAQHDFKLKRKEIKISVNKQNSKNVTHEHVNDNQEKKQQTEPMFIYMTSETIFCHLVGGQRTNFRTPLFLQDSG